MNPTSINLDYANNVFVIANFNTLIFLMVKKVVNGEFHIKRISCTRRIFLMKSLHILN